MSAPRAVPSALAVSRDGEKAAVLDELVAADHELKYAANMTLKGGMLMAATSARRMTKDADLATSAWPTKKPGSPRAASRARWGSWSDA